MRLTNALLRVIFVMAFTLTPHGTPQNDNDHDLPEDDGPEPLIKSWKFPHPPRAEQITTMEWLDEAVRTDARFLSAEAPVGVGKSPLAVTFGTAHNGTVLVPQNSLQKQYLRDWPDMANVRGSINYACSEGTKNHPSCRRSKCGVKKQGGCQYANDKRRWGCTPGSMTSYAMFFALLVHGEPELIQHPWIVADESHNMDEAIISASEVSFPETDFMKHVGRPFPHGDRIDDVGYSMEYAVEVMQQMMEGLGKSISAVGEETDETVRWQMLQDTIEDAISSIGESSWVCDKTEPDHRSSRPSYFYVKPLLPDHFFNRYMRRFRILGLSATPIAPSVAASLYGTTVTDHAVGSPFPVANRPILYRPVANMSFKNYQTSIPIMARGVDRVLGDFKNDKGIVHTSSFKMAQDLYDLLPTATKRRVILHKSSGPKREELIDTFQSADGPVVFISPSITEGLDLKGDAGRFNIIAKVPYPALGDPWVVSRKNKIAGWYDWKTALAISQASGRTTRTADDWSTTVILDQCFGGLYNRRGKLFPHWFSEALQG